LSPEFEVWRRRSSPAERRVSQPRGPSPFS
jgi:hypothetical protein